MIYVPPTDGKVDIIVAMLCFLKAANKSNKATSKSVNLPLLSICQSPPAADLISLSLFAEQQTGDVLVWRVFTRNKKTSIFGHLKHYPIPNNDLLSFNSCNIT